jgi:hypothetical protein
MLLDLKFTIFTLGIGAGTFVAALYGMNLKNFIEESDLGFAGISAWCTVFGIGVCIYGVRKLRKVQRVSMWGEHGGRSGSWMVNAERKMAEESTGNSNVGLGIGRGVRFWEKERAKRALAWQQRAKEQERRHGRENEMGGEKVTGRGKILPENV